MGNLPENRPQERALPRPVGADDGGKLPAMDVQIDMEKISSWPAFTLKSSIFVQQRPLQSSQEAAR